MPHERTSTEYNEIVGVLKSGCVFVLDDIFKYTDGFKGATRYEMEILTKDQVEAQNDPDYIADMYKDYWQEEVAHNNTELELEDWAKEISENLSPDMYSFSDDPSFRKEMRKAYEQLSDEQKAAVDKATGKDDKFVDWNCYCCGRCGKITKDDFALILRPDLLDKIIEAEKEQQEAPERVLFVGGLNVVKYMLCDIKALWKTPGKSGKNPEKTY